MPTIPAVLIVEDDAPTRHLLEALVHRNHYEAVLAGDGAEALDLLAASEFEVILLDLLLPKVDGREILRRVELATPYLLHRIIIVTAASPAEYHDCEATRSVWCILRKPFELSALEEQMMECSAEYRREASRLAARSAPSPAKTA
jgi:CheY-like chemotaxis protein